MELKRNPQYGKTKCAGCLLCSETEESALFIGIHKVMLEQY